MQPVWTLLVAIVFRQEKCKDERVGDDDEMDGEAEGVSPASEADLSRNGRDNRTLTATTAAYHPSL